MGQVLGELMKTVYLTLVNDDDGSSSEVKGDFLDEEIRVLQQYSNLVGRIRESNLVQRGVPRIEKMSWTAAGTLFAAPDFSNGELYELLHVLRPTILEREPASFQKVLALLGRKFKDQTFASHARYLRTLFEDGEYSMFMQITVADQKFFDKSLLGIWLNGTQYHTDAEKAVAWNLIEESIMTDNARAIVITQIHSRVKALLLLDHIVGLVVAAKAGDC